MKVRNKTDIEIKSGMRISLNLELINDINGMKNVLSLSSVVEDVLENGYLLIHNVKSVGRGDGQQIIDALASGKLVVAIMGPGTFTTCGHFIVLRGVTSEGKILVADPVSVRKTGMEWDIRIILNEASKKTYNNGPFWVIG